MTENTENNRLAKAAVEASKNAYAPYSKFAVGAALLASDDQVFVGCNVENASFGLTICAERVAATSAVSRGSRQFKKIAIASPKGATPCGACRQFLTEFSPELEILIIDSNTNEIVNKVSLTELLPHSFQAFD